MVQQGVGTIQVTVLGAPDFLHCCEQYLFFVLMMIKCLCFPVWFDTEYTEHPLLPLLSFQHWKLIARAVWLECTSKVQEMGVGWMAVHFQLCCLSGSLSSVPSFIKMMTVSWSCLKGSWQERYSLIFAQFLHAKLEQVGQVEGVCACSKEEFVLPRVKVDLQQFPVQSRSISRPIPPQPGIPLPTPPNHLYLVVNALKGLSLLLFLFNPFHFYMFIFL